MLLLIAALPLAPLSAEVYRIVKPDGSIEFSDDPLAGGEEVEVKSLPSYQSPPPVKRSKPVSGNKGASPTPLSLMDKRIDYRHFTFAAPINDATVFHDAKGISVVLEVVPSLQQGDEIELTLDGQVVAKGATTSFTIPEVYRGSHTLSARIIDSDGASRKQAGPITFFLRQHSIIR